MRHPASLALALAFTLSPLVQAADSDPILTKADQLLTQGQAQGAFDLLAPLEDERAGDPDYDYLLGLAALDSGRGGIAAFAFERCLAVDPKNGPCRVQMARTHLALGENGNARLELEAVQASDPPAEVKDLVGRYLGTLTQREAGEKHRLSVHALAGVGYDTNVSSTTADTQIAIPRFGGLPFTLSGISTKQEDTLGQAEVGASVNHLLSPAWSVQADASLNTRRYASVEQFDSITSDAGAGVAWQSGTESVLAKLQLQDFRLDDSAFRSLYGVLTQYQHAWSDKAAVSVYVQASHLDYHRGQSDGNRYTLGTGYSRALDTARATAIYAGLYGGKESSEATVNSPAQSFYGLRMGGSMTLQARLALTASLSVEQRQFDDASTLFLVEREDTGTDLSLGAIYQLAEKVSLRPTYTYSNNDSNTVLSDFDRHVVTLDLRYDL